MQKSITTLIVPVLALLFLQVQVPVHSAAHRGGPLYETEQLADGLYTFRYGGYRNIFIVTDDGVIATDPLNKKAAAALREEIGNITDQPVKFVAYSHSHWDHAAWAKIFKDAGAAEFDITTQPTGLAL